MADETKNQSDAEPTSQSDDFKDQIDTSNLQDNQDQAENTDVADEDATDKDEALDHEPDLDETPEPLEEDENSETIDTEDTAPIEEDVVLHKKKAGKKGFFGMILGGVICTAAGYTGAQYVNPEGWPFPGAEKEAIEIALQTHQDETTQAINALNKMITEQQTAIQTLSSQLKVQSDFVDQTQLSDRLGSLNGEISVLEQRLDFFENQPQIPSELSPEVKQAYENQLAQMQQLIEQEVNRLSTLQQNAQEEKRSAQQAQAYNALQAKIDTGADYSQEIAAFESAPSVLTAHAQTGIPTLDHLRESFPPLAREAIKLSSQSAYDKGEQNIFENFLYTQLGFRSTQAKTGDTVDAVLSRAEAYINSNQIISSLEELQNLPESAQSIFKDWEFNAQLRLSALEALNTLKAQ